MPGGGLIAVLTALGASEAVQGLGALVDLAGALGQVGQWYDEALLLGRQWERNRAALEHYAGKDASNVMALMRKKTRLSVDEVALAGMATETMMRGLTSDPEQIAALVEVAWARGGISLTGTPEDAAERTAEVFENLLDAIMRQDVASLTSWGFEIDESRLQGLTARQRQDELLAQVLSDQVARDLGALGAFEPSPYEMEAPLQTSLEAIWGASASDFSLGFWGDSLVPGRVNFLLGMGKSLLEGMSGLEEQLGAEPSGGGGGGPEKRPAPTAPADAATSSTEGPRGMGMGDLRVLEAAMSELAEDEVMETMTQTLREPLAPAPPTTTPTPTGTPTSQEVLGEDLAKQWQTAGDAAATCVAEAVERSITPEFVQDIIRRRWAQVPGMQRCPFQGGVWSDLSSRGAQP